VVDGSYLKSLVCALEKWIHSLLGSYRLVDVLIAPSQFLADECHKLGLKKEIIVIPNPLLHVPEGSPEKIAGKVVFVGRLSVEKGVDVLIRAFAGQATESTLHIIGGGPEESLLKTLTQELGLTEKVVFRGPLYGAELDREVLTAEALAVPSVWYENLPYVVTENQARGVVVIASASGGITERIRDGRNGFLFPLGDVEALSTILRQLPSMDLEAIQKQAVIDTQDLSAEKFVSRITAVYQNTLKGD
jgi:glycosyltransferase involved in cell wall biosynthesis